MQAWISLLTHISLHWFIFGKFLERWSNIILGQLWLNHFHLNQALLLCWLGFRVILIFLKALFIKFCTHSNLLAKFAWFCELSNTKFQSDKNFSPQKLSHLMDSRRLEVESDRNVSAIWNTLWPQPVDHTGSRFEKESLDFSSRYDWRIVNAILLGIPLTAWKRRIM